jgi:hypothetical protein
MTREKPHEKSSKKIVEGFVKNKKIANKLRKRANQYDDIDMEDYI